MPRLRRETKRFKRRAINSLLLAIELFNRPHDAGRAEAVLILLQHTFEMLLKAAIYQARGTIFDAGERISYRFDRCLGIARSDLRMLDEDQALTLSILDGERDCAAHNLLDLTEQALYVHTQAAVTLFDQVLTSAFAERLADHLPNRVLPLSTNPPQEMLTFLDSEFSQIKELLGPGRRRRPEVRGRLRHLMIMEENISADGRQPTDQEVNRRIGRIQGGDTWQAIFPGIASVRLDTQGHGPTVAIRFTREPTAAPVRVLRPGEPGAEEAAMVREVDLSDRFSMRLRELSENLGSSAYVTLALIHYLRLQDNIDCYHEFRMGKSPPFKRYSPSALERLKQAKETADMDEVLQKYKER
jgi:hypothetical protein